MNFKSLNRKFFILAAFNFGGLLVVWNLEQIAKFKLIFFKIMLKKTVTCDVNTTRPLLH